MRLAEHIIPEKRIPAGRILALPPFPAIVRKLMMVLAKPDFTLPEVARLIKSDAVYSGEVLRLANSAMMALRYQVVNVIHAISVLGMERIQSLVLTVAMRDFIQGGKQFSLLRNCWRHNLATALLAEAMAEPCFIERSEAYMAGLMHDLGRLALVAAFPDEYNGAAECWSLQGEELLAWEDRVVGINHADAGLLLAESWGLPPVLRETLCLRPTLPDAPLTVLRLASVACQLAGCVGFPLGEPAREWDPEWLESQIPAQAWARLAPKIDALRVQVPLKINLFECEFMPG